jgi:hypothetical protein
MEIARHAPLSHLVKVQETVSLNKITMASVGQPMSQALVMAYAYATRSSTLPAASNQLQATVFSAYLILIPTNKLACLNFTAPSP